MEINHSKMKEINRKKIIKLVLESEEITKLNISRALDISITTVSTNISELKAEGIVEEVRSLESTGGRKAIALRIKKDCRFSIGVALTPRHIKISLINLKQEVIENIGISHSNSGMEEILSIIKENIDSLLCRNNITEERLLGIGVSIPGTVDSHKGIIKYCYLLGVKDYNIKEKFNYLNVPIYVDNEANLSAYYEFLNNKNIFNNLLYISITDGLGLGIIIDGKIYRGNNNIAGEMGHLKIVVDGRQCKCGSKGCLEAYASKTALLDSYNNKSHYSINDVESFINSYNNRDEVARAVLNDYLKYLGIGISNLNMILDPGSIIIGGDINNLLEKKLDIIKDIVYKDNLFITKENCNIGITRYKESYVLGATMLPIEQFLN